MTTFEYKGYDAAGKSHAGLIEAQDLKDARKQLAGRGILPETIRAAGGDAARRASRAAAFSAEIRTMFYRELAALLGSGVALVPALDTILQAPELDRAQTRLAAVRDAVREGSPLSVALTDISSRVTPFERAVIEVGERTGGMSEALNRLAGFLEEQEKLREKLMTALLYPCIVVVLALGIGAVVLLLLLPMVQRLFAETSLELPMLTKLMLAGGRAMGLLLLLSVVAVGVGATVLRRRLRADADLRIRLDRRLFALPLIGGGRRNLASLRFVRVLGLLLERGVGLIESVPMAGRASGSPWLADCAERETAAMGEGKPLVDVIRGIRPLHPSLAAWVQAGEAGGNLPGLLENAAQRFQQGWDRLATRGMLLLEIGMTLMLGLFVTLIALAVLLPILQMNKGIMP
ncbi:MAG: type II secretion system F family protein [Kiritimatiellae bacterium]|jgi:general secretion pathway protein F|nr:type II secretion system F family protein [Kiritimatiellia bacterium]MDD4341614.1 type II secretion system F family protein [Kiritimatiellia bacterium]MDY0150088.1 type II secretion system F family protein [Kiritimatiellia bacterium]